MITIKTITLSFSDKAYAFLEQEAAIKETTVQDLINNRFSYYEQHKDDQEFIDKHLSAAHRSHINKKSRAVRKTHPFQEYILEYHPNSKQIKKTACWRTCPIQPDTVSHKDHIGDYWVEIRTYEKHSFLGIHQIKTTKPYYRKSLKSLKRKINDIMGYQHYKV